MKSSLILSVIVVLVFAGLSFTQPDLFERLEGILYEAESGFLVRGVDGESEIAIVDIDDKTLSDLGPWPWRPDLLARVCETLKEGKVRIIGIDLPLYENDSNPGLKAVEALHEKVKAYVSGKRGPAFPPWMIEDLERLEYSLDWNRRFVESVTACRNVILGLSVNLTPLKRKETAVKDGVLSRNLFTPGGMSPSTNDRPSVRSLSLPFPALATAAKGVGLLCSASDGNLSGGAHRPYVFYHGSPLPSYPLRVAIEYLRLRPEQVRVKPSRLLLKDRSIPLYKGEMLLPSRKGWKAFPHYSFSNLLSAGKPPVSLQGKIVLVGLDTAHGNPVGTPFSPRLSGSEYAANVIDSVIHERYIKRPRVMVYGELLALLLLGGVAGYAFSRLGEPAKLGVLAGMAALTLLIGASFMAIVSVWLKTAYILCCLVTLYLAASLTRLVSIKGMTRESLEANKLLGLSYQNQGLLDLAFETFKACKPASEVNDLLYHLGLEYEQRGMANGALKVYEHIKQHGGFGDTEGRISNLKATDRFPVFDSEGVRKSSGIHSAPLIQSKAKVGRYQVLEQLGKGTMGHVYKGMDPKLNRMVALKIIRFSDEFDEDMIQEIKERFFREAEIAGRLSHPSIVTIYDVGEDEDLTFMAMEYIEGEDLSHYCNKDHLLPLAKVLEVVASVAEALDLAHRSHVIHRDIKPANIMLIKTGGVKVTDFGIAKAVSSSKTKTGVILGTPNYMSPEQIMGHKIDARTDIFSLGVLLFHLLTGDLPFHGKNLSNLLFQITQGRHPPVRKYNPRIPKACDQIVARALAKNPLNRFKTAGELASYLRILVSKVGQLTKSEMTG